MKTFLALRCDKAARIPFTREQDRADKLKVEVAIASMLVNDSFGIDARLVSHGLLWWKSYL